MTMKTSSLGRLTINFKSNLERDVWKKLKIHFPSVQYEPDKIPYVQPAKGRMYIPDFKIGDIYIEAKGKLDLETRQKMIWFKLDNPDVRVIFLFMNPSNKITKKSKTTYGMWATANNFEWLDFRKDWLNEYKQLCSQ